MELHELEGLIPEEVGEVLAEYASRVDSAMNIVEIGSYKGKSACYLASRALAHVWAVDPWDMAGNETGRYGYAEEETREVFQRQVASMGYQRRITQVQAFGHLFALTWAASNFGPVGLLYVDGDHSAIAVERDVRAWIPNLASGAVVILDDWGTKRNPGVRIAADRLSKTLGPHTVEAERLAIWK